LLVGSGTSLNIERALGSISRIYPEGRVTIVARSPLTLTSSCVEKVDEIVAVGSFASRSWYYWKKLHEVRKTKYDNVFVLATNEGFPYLKLFGLACRGRSKFWVNEMGDWFNVMSIGKSIAHLRWRSESKKGNLRLLVGTLILSPYLIPRLLFSDCRWYLRRWRNLRGRRGGLQA
jgi:hypothetical protein